MYTEVSEQPIELKAEGSYPVKAFFTNPMAKALTNVVFHIEGTKLTKPQRMEGMYAYVYTCM